MSQYLYGEWKYRYLIDHDFLRDCFSKVDILFRGSVKYTSDRRTLDDIFPGGFFNPNHSKKTHGAMIIKSQMIDVWGVRRGKLFVKTLEGDFYFSSVISNQYNTCTDDQSFFKTANNSNWSNTIRDLMWFSSTAPMEDYDVTYLDFM